MSDVTTKSTTSAGIAFRFRPKQTHNARTPFGSKPILRATPLGLSEKARPNTSLPRTQKPRPAGEVDERGGAAAAMAGGDRERDADEETRNQMMQNLFGDQSEDEDEADDDDDVVEVVDEDDGHQQQLQSSPQHHQELEDDADDDEEDDARSHAHARHGGYHSVNLPVSFLAAIPIRFGCFAVPRRTCLGLG